MSGFYPVGSLPVGADQNPAIPAGTYALPAGQTLFKGALTTTMGNTGGGDKITQLDTAFVTGPVSGLAASQFDFTLVTGPLDIAVSQIDSCIVVGPIGMVTSQIEINVVINTKWKAEGQMLHCML
jgi:hypothetical protein